MMSARRLIVGVFAALAFAVAATATASACISGPFVNLSSVEGKPGQEIDAVGRDFPRKDSVIARWNGFSGEVIGDLGVPNSSNAVTGKVTIPATAKPGSYVVLFTQTAPDGKLSSVPVRAVFTVTPEGSASPVLGAQLAPQDTGRPVGLASSDDSVSFGALLLAGVGAAGVAMFLAGIASLMASRRAPAAPEAARARR